MTSSGRWRGLWDSAPGTSTSVNARRRVMSCSPTPKATSSASSSRAQVPRGLGVHRSACVRRSQAVGYFWSEALGWPLVWDQDQETAIRSPHGGPKLTWGGPPLRARNGPSRLHLDLALAVPSDLQAEVARLISLGATLLETGSSQLGWVDMADPDGNQY